MKPLTIAVSAFAAAFLGAAAFYFLVQKPDQAKTLANWTEQQAQMQQQVVSAQQQALQNQVESIKAQSVAVIDEKVAAAGEQIRQVQNEVWNDDAARRAFASAVVIAGSAKTSIAESFVSMGTMCADNQACGLTDPATYASPYVRRMDVRDGKIEITLDAQFGDGARWIRLVPSVDPNTSAAQWQCTTNATTALPPNSCERVKS
jgi:nitric oxide reductase large subunit